MKKKSKKTLNLKCYYIMVSRNFPSTHPKAGQPTFFVEKICKALSIEPPTPYGGWDAWETKELLKADPKLHTIRLNWELWQKRFEEIAAGKAYLSLRYWLDLPYKSPQQEFARLTTTDGIGIQKLSFPLGIFIDDYDADLSIGEIAKNDGLTMQDFGGWFGEIQRDKEYAILHFTQKRYPNSFTNMEYLKLHYNYEKEND